MRRPLDFDGRDFHERIDVFSKPNNLGTVAVIKSLKSLYVIDSLIVLDLPPTSASPTLRRDDGRLPEDELS